MSPITEVQGALLEPEFTAPLRPILAKWEAAVVRVAAAEKQPNLLVAGQATGTPEEILLRRFKKLPKVAREQSADRASLLLSSKVLQKRLGPFVDLGAMSGDVSVDSLLKVVKPSVPISDAQLSDLTSERFGPITSPTRAPAPFKTLRLDLFRIVCIDETNGLFGSELGDDEIELSGMTIDETADIKALPAIKCGDFNDGTRRDYIPNKRLYTFNLAEATKFPRSYFVTFLMVEADQGNLSDTVNAMVAKLKKEASDALSKWINSVTGIPPWLISASVTWLVGKIVNKIIAVWEDDPFKPQTIELRLPDATSKFLVGFDGSPTVLSRVVNFNGPGEYAMRYRWTLSTTAGGS